MPRIGHVLGTGVCFLLMGVLIRYLLPREKKGPVNSADTSRYTEFRHWLHDNVYLRLGAKVSAFFTYSGIFLVMISFL
jgi:hypothetical protein